MSFNTASEQRLLYSSAGSSRIEQACTSRECLIPVSQIYLSVPFVATACSAQGYRGKQRRKEQAERCHALRGRSDVAMQQGPGGPHPAAPIQRRTSPSGKVRLDDASRPWRPPPACTQQLSAVCPVPLRKRCSRRRRSGRWAGAKDALNIEKLARHRKFQLLQDLNHQDPTYDVQHV